jgi:hypothetical protein
MKTRLKLVLVNAVILCGSLLIIWVQWPEAMQRHGDGHGFEPGFGSSVYLAVLLTGIPVLLYAVAVHVIATQTHWLFAPDELQEYRARQLLKSLISPASAPPEKATATSPIRHDD